MTNLPWLTSGCFASLEVFLENCTDIFSWKNNTAKQEQILKERMLSFCHVLLIAADVRCSCIDISWGWKVRFHRNTSIPNTGDTGDGLGCRSVPGRIRPKHGPLHTFRPEFILIGKHLIIIYYLQHDEKSIEVKALKTIRFSSIKCIPQVNEEGIQY